MIVQQVYVPTKVIDFIEKESSNLFPLETGGTLIGRFNNDYAEVVQAVGPGLQALHETHYFKRDGQFTQNELDKVFEQYLGRYDYLGEWHSHCAQYGPSAVDKASLNWISTNPAYNLLNPFLLICQYNQKSFWRCLLYQLQNGKLVQQKIVRHV